MLTYAHVCSRMLILGTDLESASAAVAAGTANVDDFLFFYKYSSWAPSQLEIEQSNQIWYLSTFFPSRFDALVLSFQADLVP